MLKYKHLEEFKNIIHIVENGGKIVFGYSH